MNNLEKAFQKLNINSITNKELCQMAIKNKDTFQMLNVINDLKNNYCLNIDWYENKFHEEIKKINYIVYNIDENEKENTYSSFIDLYFLIEKMLSKID